MSHVCLSQKGKWQTTCAVCSVFTQMIRPLKSLYLMLLDWIFQIFQSISGAIIGGIDRVADIADYKSIQICLTQWKHI